MVSGASVLGLPARFFAAAGTLARRPAVAACLLALLTAAVALPTLGANSLWLDEIFSWRASRSFSDLVAVAFSDRGSMLPYYTLQYLTHWLGDSEGLLRLPALAAGVAAVVLTYLIGAPLFGRAIGAGAALLLAVHPFFLHYAQEARGYTMGMALGVASQWLFLAGVQSRKGIGHWAAYVTVTLLAAASHYGVVLILTAQPVLLALQWRRRAPGALVAPLAAGAVAAAAVAGYMAAFGVFSAEPAGEVVPTTLSGVMDFVMTLSGGGFRRAWVIAALTLVLAAILIVRARRYRFENLAFAVCWFALPCLLLWGLQIFPVFSVRYLIFSVPAYCLLLSAALGVLPPLLRAAMCGLFLAAYLLGIREYLGSGSSENWRRATAEVNELACPGAATIYYAYFSALPFEYYLDREAAPRLRPIEIASADYQWHSRNLPPPSQSVLDSLAENYGEVWLILSHEAALGNSASEAHQQKIFATLERDYVRQNVYDFAGIRAVRFTSGQDADTCVSR